MEICVLKKDFPPSVTQAVSFLSVEEYQALFEQVILSRPRLNAAVQSQPHLAINLNIFLLLSVLLPGKIWR